MEKQMFSPRVLAEIKAKERAEKERREEIMKNKRFSTPASDRAFNDVMKEFLRVALG